MPSYWDITVHAPASGIALGSDMIIDDLPTGSIFFFIANAVVSFFFQFIGFVLTYILHTSHAAKYGSRAGLGLTLIQYGFYWRSMSTNDGEGNNDSSWDITPSSADGTVTSGASKTADMVQTSPANFTQKDVLAFCIMTLGETFSYPS